MDGKKYKPSSRVISVADIIILDKDGTVLDSMDATLEGFVETMQPYASKEYVIEIVKKLTGAPPDEQYAAMLKRPRNDPLVLERVEALWKILKKTKPKPFPDALEVIPKLAADGHTLVLSTGYRSDIAEAQLKMVELRRYFDLILGHDPPIIKGMHHMEAVMKKYGLSKEGVKRVVIVGDGPGDMIMGQGYTTRLYGIDRMGNSRELVKAGAVEVFPDLREFYRYFSK